MRLAPLRQGRGRRVDVELDFFARIGPRATKAAMVEGGVIKSEAVRHPLPPLDPATREGLIELARPLEPLALRWGR